MGAVDASSRLMGSWRRCRSVESFPTRVRRSVCLRVKMPPVALRRRERLARFGSLCQTPVRPASHSTVLAGSWRQFFSELLHGTKVVGL